MRKGYLFIHNFLFIQITSAQRTAMIPLLCKRAREGVGTKDRDGEGGITGDEVR